MRVEQQKILLVLLSLFSIGILLPVVCVSSQREDDNTSYNEVRECEQRENLENVELGTALTTFDTTSMSLFRSVESVPGENALEPEQACYWAVGSRAPPALGC